MWGSYSGSTHDVGDIVLVQKDAKVEKFEVVGITQSWNSYVLGENYLDTDQVTVNLEFKDNANMKEIMNKISSDIVISDVDYNSLVNSLRGLSAPTNELLLTAITLIGIIVFIISLSSMSLIYNSFYLSLEKKLNKLVYSRVLVQLINKYP